MISKNKSFILCLGASLLLGAFVSQQHAAAASTTAAAVPEHQQMFLYPLEKTAYSNGVKLEMQAPLVEREGRHYIPAVELPGLFGTPVQWNESTGSVQITTPKVFLEASLTEQSFFINGEKQPWGKNALLQENRLYLDITWLEQWIAFHSKFNKELSRMELQYVKPSADRTLFTNDAMPNVKPVAKFAVDKEAYRIGEPIHYTNISYDPKGTALKSSDWIGNADVIYTPGLYKVSLTVQDSLGNYSETYSQNILVLDEPYLNEFEHDVYHAPVGTYVRKEEAELRKYLRGIPQLEHKEQKPTDRPLIVSDSPETFEGKGFLYQEKVNGKARLYATHVNGTDRRMKFAILVRNLNPDREVKIKTTNQGEVYPTIYANLMGNEPTIDFLQARGEPQSMVLRPQEEAYYKMMPDFYPGQGMNVMYDVETDGDVLFSFVAMEHEDHINDLTHYPKLPYRGNVRGTFSGSEVIWNIDASTVKKPSSFAIGDGTSDQFVTGFDYFHKEPSLNLGNYGVVYKIHIDAPPAVSVLVLPRGGVFKGPFEVNGRIIQVPASGVMMDYQGYTIIARTNGTEKSIDLEFSPASGSAFPIDIILYPLDKK
ncbi:stalk domain-containing protein [Paenibacillus sp. GD4]|uniref:stalk domain-containing protein n=1 Tax=Paenibacillus sp. GD4 TaxID=3068890 RepID=UPI002796AFBD|nr:stalk domain-containing protein [Paenibacillus sp. GD4]MDQ1913357.1 stalk domain-containing protein [Paenibacillus sp. GD4]